MSNVVRLVNGGSIQVRTGVIQGIGPIGPTGPQGPQGNQGAQGPVGDPGPMGQIVAQSSLTNVGTSNPVTANTDTTISFGSVQRDLDLNCFGPGNSNCTLTNAGDYMLSVWLCFNDAASGYRDVFFYSGGVTIARSSRSATAGSAYYCDLTFPYRAVGGDVLNVVARSSAATAISSGSWSVVRIGSGPPGPTGGIGPTGAQGPIGPTGGVGPAGTPGGPYSNYGGLHT